MRPKVFGFQDDPAGNLTRTAPRASAEDALQVIPALQAVLSTMRLAYRVGELLEQLQRPLTTDQLCSSVAHLLEALRESRNDDPIARAVFASGQADADRDLEAELLRIARELPATSSNARDRLRATALELSARCQKMLHTYAGANVEAFATTRHPKALPL